MNTPISVELKHKSLSHVAKLNVFGNSNVLFVFVFLTSLPRIKYIERTSHRMILVLPQIAGKYVTVWQMYFKIILKLKQVLIAMI